MSKTWVEYTKAAVDMHAPSVISPTNVVTRFGTAVSVIPYNFVDGNVTCMKIGLNSNHPTTQVHCYR